VAVAAGTAVAAGATAATATDRTQQQKTPRVRGFLCVSFRA
jgi:hypothetical protein